MFYGHAEVIGCLYGMTRPDPKLEKDRLKKVAKAIDRLGDKYLLSKPVERVNANPPTL
jgi:hypothetical protein